jgi:hypothetical protein
VIFASRRRARTFTDRRARLERDAARSLATCTAAAAEPAGEERRPLRKWLAGVVVLAAVAGSSALAIADDGGTPSSVADTMATEAHAGAARRQTNTLGRVRPRTFGWAAVAGARGYVVRFFRGGRPIFERRTHARRVFLPVMWTYRGHRMKLAPGRYAWTVQPFYGSSKRPRYGPVVIRAAFTLSA